MYIYKTVNLINNKVYIGKSEKEFDGSYFGSGILLWKAIKKYGIKNFKVQVIETCETVDLLNEREIYWIDQHKSNSYNLAKGGSGGWTTKYYSKESFLEYRKKLSNAQQGRIVTEETKQKLRKSNLGKLMGDREKQKETLRDMWKDPNSIYNSPEFRKRLSESSKGHSVSEETREKIRQTKIGGKNGMAVKIKVDEEIFETRRLCAEKFGISETAVTKRCKSKHFKNWEII
jgi:group I intron endonuclease